MSSSQEKSNIDRIAEISTNIRKAVLAALPTPPEQFMTLMVPGKVVNFDNYKVDKEAIVLPTVTELNQAVLCDDMPVLSTLQMGPTGRSVARSYAATISKLVPAATPIGIDDGSKMTEDQRRHQQAMRVLSSDIPDMPGTSLVELYTEKQSKYTKAVTDKTKAFNDALEYANRLHPNKPNLARDAYDKWVGENARTYRNHVQAAYMDWVVTGKKEEVEYWFSVVDQDSALARVEQSKEVMRWAVVQDSDGSCEYQKVKLEPQDWANKCINKMNSKTNQTKTAEWYTWEINRLEKTNAMLKILADNPPKFDADGSADDGLKAEADDAQSALSTAMSEHVKAVHEYRTALNALKGKKADGSSEDQESKAKVDEALKAYQGAQKKLQECQAEYDKVNLKKLSYENKNAHNNLLAGLQEDGFAENQQKTNQEQIDDYKEKRKALLKAEAPKEAAIDEYAESMGIPKRAPEPAKPSASETPEPDYFTPISVEVTSSSEKTRTESSATSFSAGASASWGFWSVSASVSHSEAHSKAMSELSSSSVKISFECMRVDITRPWLRPELFYEHDLVPGPGVSISPGFSRLHQLIDGTAGPDVEGELENYSIFSYYPTAFLVACNVVLEISGSTSSLETYMNSSSTSASASVGYGPFSISGSGSHSKSDAGSTCKTTASGCRIEIKAPQIIGWISQMVPALPRLQKEKTTGFSQGGFKPIGWK
ncbi:hypothetical protein B0J17DRAFT_629921 [Rhizoctonia solani]|nr:hypothetical protein B0J17DRAFT_629921 [Rhizoctonia solani]